MDVYKLVKTGICTTVRYGTAAGVGIGTGLMLAIRNGAEERDGKQKKHTLQEGAIIVSASAAGYFAGDKLANMTGEKLDKLREEWLKITGKTVTPEKKKKPIDMDDMDDYVTVDNE